MLDFSIKHHINTAELWVKFRIDSKRGKDFVQAVFCEICVDTDYNQNSYIDTTPGGSFH